MTTNSLHSHESTSELPLDPYTWDLESVFLTPADWEAEFAAVIREIPRLRCFEGRVLESAETLHEYLMISNLVEEQAGRLKAYAYLRYHVNTNDEAANILLSRADQLLADIGVAQSFFSAEVLRAPAERVEKNVLSNELLQKYGHLFREIERSRVHTPSAEVEAAIETLAPVTSSPEAIRTALHDAEMRFEPIMIDGERREITHGTVDEFLAYSDRSVRQAAYESYTDAYMRYPLTFAQTLSAQAKTSLVFNRVRNFKSTFEAKMFNEGFAPQVFHSVLEACAAHRSLFHRYFKAKAALLGLARISEFDLLAPLSSGGEEISYDRAREVILEALQPLGDEYVQIARRGLYEERWADVYPRPGKYSNAFSGGAYGTRPFFLLNYAPKMMEVGTTAHELGHSVHSYLTHRSQPVCYADYAMSVAETASNLNQVLLRDRVLKGADRETALAVLEEAFFFADRYLFLMPTMSEVEHKLHTRVAEGGAMSASELCEATVEAFRVAYGGTVEFEPVRLGVKWEKFCHFYSPYYFFQYAIGISAAMSIGRRLLSGEAGIQEKYLRFLRAGGSDYPTEIFKIVDIDITKPDVYRDAFKVVEGYVQQLEGLV